MTRSGDRTRTASALLEIAAHEIREDGPSLGHLGVAVAAAAEVLAVLCQHSARLGVPPPERLDEVEIDRWASQLVEATDRPPRRLCLVWGGRRG